MKTKKIVSLVMCSAIAVSVFAGCGKASANVKNASKDASCTLKFALWDKNQEPTIREMADQFTKENPNIKVEIEITPWDQYWTKLETAATGGSLSDIFWMNGPNVGKYVQGNIIMPLDDNIKADSYDMTKYPESLVSLYTVKDKKYAIPKGFDTIGLWYNKEIFDNAGVAYPDGTWNWDKLVETAKTLTDASKGIYGIAAPLDNQAHYYDTILQEGGNIISDDKKKSGFDSPEAIKGVQDWVDLINDGISPTLQQLTDTTQDAMFESGKLAMVYQGSWLISEYTANENIKDKIDVTVLPTIKKSATVIHGLGNAIYANTKYPEQAWKFVSWLGGKEANDMQAKAAIDIPAYSDSMQYFTESNTNINLSAFTDQLDYSVMYPCSQQTAKWQQIETDNLKKAYAGEITVEEACKTIAKQMNEILASEN